MVPDRTCIGLSFIPETPFRYTVLNYPIHILWAIRYKKCSALQVTKNVSDTLRVPCNHAIPGCQRYTLNSGNSSGPKFLLAYPRCFCDLCRRLRSAEYFWYRVTGNLTGTKAIRYRISDTIYRSKRCVR